MSDVPQVRIQLLSNPLYLSGARELVSSVARRLGFSDEACGQIALAVDEALCNVIRHGYQRASDRPIWISLFPEGELPVPGCDPKGLGATVDARGVTALKIVIEDEARQVDPAMIKSRDLEDVRPGGLGVHIIKTVMDEARYARRGDVGMSLTMVKRKNSNAGGSAGMVKPPGCGCAPAGGAGQGGDGEPECGHA